MKLTDSYLLYDKEDINEENYLDFIERFYSEEALAHKKNRKSIKAHKRIYTRNYKKYQRKYVSKYSFKRSFFKSKI